MRTNVDKDNQFFKEVIENCYDEIFVADPKKPVTLYTNPSFERFFNISRSEVINKKSFLYSNEMIDSSSVYLALEKKRRVTVEMKLKTGRTLLSTATPVFDEEGTIKFIVGNSRDLSELQTEKEELNTDITLAEKYQLEIANNGDDLKKISGSFLFKSDKAVALIKQVKHVAKFDTTILIEG